MLHRGRPDETGKWKRIGLLEPQLRALVVMPMVVIMIVVMPVGVGKMQGVDGLVPDLVVNLPERGRALGGRLAAVLIFGGDAGLPPRQGRDLHADPAKLGVYRLAAPGEGVPLHFLAAHPEGGALVEEEVLQSVGVLGLGEGLQEYSGAALFHLGRNDGNVQRTSFHQMAGKVADELW
jgi:hypothetical protein